MKMFVNIFGWYGALAVLAAYILVSFNAVKGTDLIYQLLIVSGSLGVAAISLYDRVYQSVFLNGVFVAVGLVAIWNIFFPFY